jgi:hypothetical protein
VSKQAYVKETPHLTSSPSTPATGWTKHYFHPTLDCFVYYDETRAKWLSFETFTYIVSRSGNTGAGVSLQSGGGVPTSTSPLHLGSKNVCLVSVAVTTGATEDFTLGVSDISGGSGVAYTKSIPSGTKYVDDAVNQNFNANDLIDVFVSAVGGSGNINNLVTILKFKKRA